jgi:HSP20 family protein
MEVYETEGELIVTAEIAGIDEARLSVVVEQDLLRLRGERLDDREGERRSYHETGIARGQFAADVYLPFPVDSDRAAADYSNGMLRIRLPKASARTIVPRRLEPSESRGEER